MNSTNKFFKQVEDGQLFNEVETQIKKFEKKFDLELPNDYRNFLINLEMYIASKRTSIDDITELSEHVDNLFCKYYFTLSNIPGRFEVTDLANLTLGYALLDEMQRDQEYEHQNEHKNYITIGNIWYSENYGYYLALNCENGEVHLLPKKGANEELNLNTNSYNSSTIFISKTFKIFLEDIL